MQLTKVQLTQIIREELAEYLASQAAVGIASPQGQAGIRSVVTGSDKPSDDPGSPDGKSADDAHLLMDLTL